MKSSKKFLGLFMAVLILIPMFTFGTDAAAKEEISDAKINPGDILYAEDFENSVSLKEPQNLRTSVYPCRSRFDKANGKLIITSLTPSGKENTSATLYPSLYELVSADVMKGLKAYNLSFDVKYIKGSADDLSIIFNGQGKTDRDGNAIKFSQCGKNIELIKYSGDKNVYGISLTDSANQVQKGANIHAEIRVSYLAEHPSCNAVFKFMNVNGVESELTYSIPWGNIYGGSGSVKLSSSGNGKFELDNFKIIDILTGKNVINDDFGPFTTTSTAFRGQFEQSYVSFNGGTGIRLKTGEMSYHKLVDESALKGQKYYTISYTVKLNSASSFGVAFGAYSDSQNSGHKVYIKSGADDAVSSEVYDANGKQIYPNQSSNFGASFVDENFIKVIIEVNASTGKMRSYYLSSSISKPMCKGDTLKSVSSIYLVTRGAADVILDDVTVMAGGYADMTSVNAFGIQSTVVQNGVRDVRFVAGYNGLLDSVKEVGFTVKAYTGKTSGVKFDRATTTVYNSIIGGGAPITAVSMNCDFLYGLIITDVPTTVIKFEIIPYFITQNGEKICCMPKIINGNLA